MVSKNFTWWITFRGNVCWSQTSEGYVNGGKKLFFKCGIEPRIGPIWREHHSGVGHYTQSQKIPGLNHADVLGLALGPNLIMRLPPVTSMLN